MVPDLNHKNISDSRILAKKLLCQHTWCGVVLLAGFYCTTGWVKNKSFNLDSCFPPGACRFEKKSSIFM